MRCVIAFYRYILYNHSMNLLDTTGSMGAPDHIFSAPFPPQAGWPPNLQDTAQEWPIYEGHDLNIRRQAAHIGRTIAQRMDTLSEQDDLVVHCPEQLLLGVINSQQGLVRCVVDEIRPAYQGDRVGPNAEYIQRLTRMNTDLFYTGKVALWAEEHPETGQTIALIRKVMYGIGHAGLIAAATAEHATKQDNRQLDAYPRGIAPGALFCVQSLVSAKTLYRRFSNIVTIVPQHLDST
jgi:hypothetical protein